MEVRSEESSQNATQTPEGHKYEREVRDMEDKARTSYTCLISLCQGVETVFEELMAKKFLGAHKKHQHTE